MKTITTFIIALTTLILSGVVFLYTINIAKYIPTTFYNIDKSESYTFSFTFVLASVLSFILTMSLISVSIKYFTLYLKYYNNYMRGKRDREIKDKVENAKYNQLYEDLRDCETVELKEAVLKTFYSTKDIAKATDKDRISDMIESINRTPFMYRPRNTGKSGYPDLAGFNDINFERKE